MTRRIYLIAFFLIFCASTAWPKWKEEEQQYLDDHFGALEQQIRSLATQVQTLNTSVAELRQSQAQLQAVIIRQQRALQDIEQMVSSMRLGGEENFSTLRTALNQLRADQQKAFSALTGQPTAPAAGTTAAAPAPRPAVGAPAAPQAVQGYITVIEGDSVMVDIGSAQGLRTGARLAVFKATDQNTRVGVLEVTQVVDGTNSRARIVTMNPGVRPDFSDVVRLE